MADINALSSDATWWAAADNWALGIVAVGVVLEGIAEWLPKERRETRVMLALTRTGWLILVLALAGEWIAQHRKDADDAMIIAFLNDGTARAMNLAASLGVTVDNLKSVVAKKTAEADASIQALTAAASAAETKVTSLQERQMQRHLTSDQMQELTEVLTPFARQKARVTCVMNDGEACTYANDFFTVLMSANWDLGDKPGVTQGVFAGGTATTNVQITLNQEAAQAGNIPPAIAPFLNALLKWNLIDTRTAFINPGTAAGTIEVRVGPRAPLSER